MKIEPIVYFHNSKEHGLGDNSVFDCILNDVKSSVVKLLFVPDAGSNDIKECAILKKMNCDVIITDHHEINKENKDAIVINPFLIKDYPNVSSSGSLITWKLLQKIDEEIGNNYSDKYIDLVSFSILSDSMDVRTLENRAILNIGMKNFQNKALLAFVEGIEKPGQEESSFSRKVETPTDVSFNFVPLINSAVRMGSQEDKKMLFDAFSEIYSEYDYKNPRTKEEKIETIYERVFRLCKNTKAKQDKETVKALESIKKDIEENNRNRHKILFCRAGDDVDKSLSGLCAIKLANEYNKPVVLLREGKKGFLSGSIRNFDGSPLTDLKGFIESFGYTNWVQGHKSAAGISLTTPQIQKLIPLINKKLESYSFTKQYNIDFQFELTDFCFNDIPEELYSMRYYYAQGIGKSYFLIKNIPIKSSDIQFMGKNKDTFKVKLGNGLDLIKFRLTPQDPFYDRYCVEKDFTWSDENLEVDIIGSMGVNDWNGKRSYQIILEDYDFRVVESGVKMDNTLDNTDDEW